MRSPLFVYGTLSDPDLLAAVLGRRLSPDQFQPAAAPGWRAVHYPSRIYPALVRAPGSAAPGRLLFGLTPFEVDLLDVFEGEEYRRAPLPVIVDTDLEQAEAYLPTIGIAADAEPWSLSRWQENHKARVLVAERAVAGELRARLIAIRPN